MSYVAFEKCAAKFMGAMLLVAFVCGVLVVAIEYDTSNLVPTALAFGLVIAVMVYSIGNISGCHINPTVSFTMLLNKKMSAMAPARPSGGSF